MSFKRWFVMASIAIAACGTIGLTGCDAAPADVTPAVQTPEELEAYNKQAEEAAKANR